MGKIENEMIIMGYMIQLYCRRKHHSLTTLCRECEELKKYAIERLTRCPFQEDKSACKNCLVHCYQKDKRTEIRNVMKFSGKRIVFYSPILFYKHYLG